MPSGEEFERRLPGWLTGALPVYLPSRRWFADKGREIEAARLQDFAWLVPPGPAPSARTRAAPPPAPALALALIRVDLSGGGGATYQIPLAWTALSSQAEPAGEAIAEILDGEGGWLAEAMSAPGFGPACLAALGGARRLRGRHGVFVFVPSPRRDGEGADLDALAAGAARLSRAEQSNSTLLYADASGANRLLFKCFRRLEAGRNPDAEISGYLTAHGAAHLVPALAGTLEYHPRPAPGAAAGEAWTLGIFQAFIPNEGDGWEYVLRWLSAAAAAPEAEREARAAALLAPLRQLARCTAALHLALAAAPASEPELAPAPISAADWTGWSEEIAASAARLASELARHPEAAGLRPRLAAWRRPEVPDALAKIRVHGDFHLGQTLRTRDGGWRILDFEGEPLRPLALRRQKFCALKDVAGLLRSLDYAAGTAARAAGAAPARLPGWLEGWRQQARQVFQDAYFAQLDAAAAGRGRSLAPAAAADRAALLDFFELEKALYEAGYELRNRPDWLPLPLAGLRRLLA